VGKGCFVLTMEEVVKLQWLDDGIAFVTMEDRASKNRSSPRFTSGIEMAFRAITHNANARVVVITGYDNYFCCGGTRDELVLLASQQAKFTDFRFYDQLLRCELPVVAAMQGHAIGGGLVFGAYADVLVMAEECIYSANFMHFGIPPGVGATWILPRRFGPTIGWEMLFNARSYYGGELRTRGAGPNFAKKAEVVSVALTLAREIADKPVLALRQLKRSFYESVRQEYAAAIERELRIQTVAFANPEILTRIQGLYRD
jgi:polyketide biosynthesis enoyl-CoA hydratase PksI